MTTAVACPSCGKPVDTLRAGHVAILDGRFCYFCEEACKRSYVLAGPRPPPSEVETAQPPRVKPVAEPARRVPPQVVGVTPEPVAAAAPPAADETRVLRDAEERADPSAVPAPPPPAPDWAPTTSGAPARGPLATYAVHAVTSAGILAGCLAPSLGLLGPSAQAARFTFATIALLACGGRIALVERDPSDVHPLASLLSVAAVWGVALYARGAGELDARALRLASVAGLAAAVHLVAAVLVDRAREGVRSARAWIRRRLDVPVRVLRGGQTVIVAATDVKPGEEIAAVAGDILGVDARVMAGDARVTPWIDAAVEVSKKEGDAVVAGARIVSGTLRAVTTWSGPDRAWLKLVDSPTFRPDVVGPLARGVRVSLERGAIVAAAVVAGLGMANRAAGVDVVAMAAVTAFCVAGVWAAGVVGLHQARGPISALAYGVVFRDAASFDAAGRTDIAVLCSRSTLLMGAPEIVALEGLGSLDAGRVLALAAGASAASPLPSSSPFLAATRARGDLPESVRHATDHAGLGVTALAASGERLVVGSRTLLLREKVSIAVADARVAQLEGEGRSVTLVALGGKLVGLLALQDGLRPGARAAVQRLLDAGVEPVLLGGEARETCETIGRAVDIDHVRPEVLPQDRGKEVRALADAGHVVAVLGHPAGDGAALGAADVSVALRAAGASPGEWAICLASDDVRDAARALAIAIESRNRTKVAVALGLVPGGIAVLGIALGLLPLAVGPLVSLSGLVAAVVHARK